MKIICGLGTAARFAILCIVIGLALGFVLGLRAHPGTARANAASSSPAAAFATVADPTADT
jgi:hypothetical protein